MRKENAKVPRRRAVPVGGIVSRRGVSVICPADGAWSNDYRLSTTTIHETLRASFTRSSRCSLEIITPIISSRQCRLESTRWPAGAQLREHDREIQGT